MSDIFAIMAKYAGMIAAEEAKSSPGRRVYCELRAPASAPGDVRAVHQWALIRAEVQPNGLVKRRQLLAETGHCHVCAAGNLLRQMVHRLGHVIPAAERVDVQVQHQSSIPALNDRAFPVVNLFADGDPPKAQS